MDGQAVYREVLKYKNILMQLLEWAEKDRAKHKPASVIRDSRDYVRELQKLTAFLNQNTSNSLFFKKNTLNVIFKDNTDENVRIIHKMLQDIYIAQSKIEAVIATIPAKDQKTLSIEFLEADAALNKYVQDLEAKLYKRGIDPISVRNEGIPTRHDSVQSIDLVDLHTVDEEVTNLFRENDLVKANDLIKENDLVHAPKKKLVSFNLFRSKTNVVLPSTPDVTNVEEERVRSSSPNRPN